MARIVNKLNLNKTPQLVDNNSMIFAKNIKILKDGTIGPDDGVKKVYTNYNIISQIVGLNSKIYLFVEVPKGNTKKIIVPQNYDLSGDTIKDVYIKFHFTNEKYYVDNNSHRKTKDFTDLLLHILNEISGVEAHISREGIEIIYNTANRVRIECGYTDGDTQKPICMINMVPAIGTEYKIIEYDELSETTKEIKSAWTYHGGEITGCVTNNILNETILTICEKPKDEEINVPIKHINLNICKETDDESVYTQNPNIPITNLHLNKTYTKTIPNGVYQFFIRYKVNNSFYTNWMPCSKECFAGSPEVTRTIQGQLKHVNIHKDAKSSFIFDVEHLFAYYNTFFTEYQIGFILSHDDAVVARSWKSFTFDINEIYFDYDEVEEINIDDLLKVNYELFNIENIAYYKNKLYIADYKETNFNENLSKYASSVKVTLQQKTLNEEGVVSIGNAQLESTGTYGNIYDKWGSRPIKELFNSDLNKTSININSSSEITSKNNKPNGIVTITSNWNVDTDPDLYWMNKAVSDVINPPEGFVGSFTAPYPNDWKKSEYLTPVNPNEGGWIFQNNPNIDKQHPFQNLPYLKNNWYYAAGSKEFNIPTDRGYTRPFYISNQGFAQRDKDYLMNDNFKLSIDNAYRNVCPGTIIVGIYIVGNDGTRHYLVGSDIPQDELKNPCNFEGIVVSQKGNATTEEILNTTKSLIALNNDYDNNPIVGVDRIGNYYAKIGNNIISFDTIFVEYSDFKYETSYINNSTTDVLTADFRVDSTRINRVMSYVISVNDRYIKDSYVEAQHTTLMPFTDYEFYIHYVKQNGVVTNGYYITTAQKDKYEYSKEVKDTELVNIIYPKFENITIPEDYVSCFISIYKKGGDVARGFNHSIKDGYHYLDCLECDTLLYNSTNNVIILDSNGVEITNDAQNEARYYSSGTTDPVYLLGNTGCIRWLASDNENSIYDSINFGTITVLRNAEYNTFALLIEDDHNVIDYKLSLNDATTKTEVDNFLQKIKVKRNELSYSVVEVENGFEVTLGVNRGAIKGFSAVYINTYMPTSAIRDRLNQVKQTATFVETSTDYDGYWIKINSQKGSNKNKTLIKLTPYIKQEDSAIPAMYDSYENLNMIGFVARVFKLNRDYANDIYYSGTDIYSKEIDTENTIRLKDIDDYVSPKISNPAYIMSNFNLNYCSLTEDVSPQIRKYNSKDETIKNQQIIKGVQSLTSSYILELQSMYRDYTRKTYIPYDAENTITEFNNTIRSSNVNSDESHRSIYSFEANDYYNVPTNRGKIVSLFTIVESIYVHTEHSLYKFVGRNTLSSEDSEISLKEGNVFETGIQEVFDTNNGYAGLQDKKHSVVTYNCYVFYDKLANTIYAYKGNTAMEVISDSINKLLNIYNILNIYFVADEYDNRIYINIITDNGNICLSYNYKLKNFISIHDINFNKAFSSRLNTYFIKSNEYTSNCYKLDKSIYNQYDTLYKQSMLRIDDMYYSKYDNTHIVENCVDVIFNRDYELVKTLDFIEWICSEIKQYGESNNLCAEETLDTTYLGFKLRIYSDTTYTELFDFSKVNGGSDRQNDHDIRSKEHYTLPRYNRGVWSFNYFRDIKNIDDIFDYAGHNALQDKSLIYGKYFVIRFIFKNKNFKLENVHFNTNKR